MQDRTDIESTQAEVAWAGIELDVSREQENSEERRAITAVENAGRKFQTD